MKIFSKDYKKGVTLVELFVVFAIIGILSGIVLFISGQVRKKARDAQRLQELRQLQTALQVYYEDNGKYPDRCPLHPLLWCRSTDDRDSGKPGIQWIKFLVEPGYASTHPLDPLNIYDEYEYRLIVHGAHPSPGWGHEYILTAALETPHPDLPKILSPSSGLENWYPLDCRDAFPDAVDCVVFEEP